MGERQNRLNALLNLTSASPSVRPVPFPTRQDVSDSDYSDEVMRIYIELGGIRSDIPLNLRSWDLEADDIAIELDEDLHFNRYRALTLESTIYARLSSFPLAEYKRYCVDHELNCISAGSYGGKWTNPSCESQFGQASANGDFSGNGSPRWKQRAFYDYVKDLTPLLYGLPLSRVSIWDPLIISGKEIELGEALYMNIPEAGNVILSLIKKRSTRTKEETDGTQDTT